ncbi:MAG: penicillin acylase family protein [Asgard group archaeon]|nr:penicillin acylase family protein [Asgard group archaeon]
MDITKRNTIISLAVVGLISVGVLVGFSIPLGIFPPLGELLFPGNGLWNIDEEVPKMEVITSSYLTEDVTIYRDQWGIPHIYGHSEEDLGFAIGYVHAQDRLLQMDLARRSIRGQLSEIMGESYLADDRNSLNKLMDYWTDESLKVMEASSHPSDVKLMAVLEDYCNGINSYIDKIRTLPLEFQFLGYEPEHWTPSDTFAFIKYMSEMLTWGYEDFITVQIQDAIGADGFAELYDYPIPYQVPICTDYGEYNDSALLTASSESSIDPILVELSNSFIESIMTIPKEKQFFEQTEIIGSNNWAVNGSKTASGKPIISNDMHLSFNVPGIWYEAHLVDISPGADFNLYGFFLAGVPWPIVGHNSYVGWGLTNAAFDVIDWYYYDVVNDTHYMYKGEPTPYEIIEYDIKVKGRAPEHFEIKTTVHGPVFETVGTDYDMTNYTNKVFACKWIGQSVTLESRAIYEFSHAKNRAEFDTASSFFSTPAQNIHYGDIYGNIGIRPTGKAPIRNDTGIPDWHLGNGSMIYNGSAGHGEWIGFIPFEDLPHTENPETGYVLSANQISAGPEYLANYTIQNPIDVSNGYRARRINTLLSTHDNLTVEDMIEIQLDCYSTKAGNFSTYLLDVIGTMPSKTTVQQEAYELLQGWNFMQDKDLAAPSIFNVWFDIYQQEVFNDDVINLGSHRYPSRAVLEWLTKNNATSKWFDNIDTPAVETRDDIILLAFEKAITALATHFESPVVSTWLWGEIHRAYFPHLTGLPFLGYGPVSVDGTGDTVTPFGWSTLYFNGEIRPATATSGASERMILDFGNLSNSISVIPSGQRGISNSIHYIDQLLLYLDGEYHTQYFAADSIAEFKESWIESTLILKAEGGL